MFIDDLWRLVKVRDSSLETTFQLFVALFEEAQFTRQWLHFILCLNNIITWRYTCSQTACLSYLGPTARLKWTQVWEIHWDNMQFTTNINHQQLVAELIHNMRFTRCLFVAVLTLDVSTQPQMLRTASVWTKVKASKSKDVCKPMLWSTKYKTKLLEVSLQVSDTSDIRFQH